MEIEISGNAIESEFGSSILIMSFQVDLLWRRALSDKSGRIFCVMFVDQLSYDVSEQAVRGLEKLMKDSSGKKFLFDSKLFDVFISFHHRLRISSTITFYKLKHKLSDSPW